MSFWRDCYRLFHYAFRKDTMSKFRVNGIDIDVPDGATVEFKDNQLYINGSLFIFSQSPSPLTGIVKVIYEGQLQNLKCDRDIECGAVGNNVSGTGDIEIKGSVGGNVSSTGDIKCGDVKGGISGTGDVTCGSVGGRILTTGDVNRR